VAAFSVPISVEELRDEVVGGSVRLEIELHSVSAPLVASEVEVEEPEDLFDEEEIESRVTAVADGGAGALLTLELGGLEIEVGPGTRFRDERGGSELAMTAFLDHLGDELSSGRRPAIEVKRPAPPEPQAPDDRSFFATKVRLNDESSEPEIEINADDDNVEAVGPGQGVLRVLALEIEMDVAGGRTEIERETEDAFGEVDFEGLVSSVDVAGASVTLHSGIVVRIVAGTRIDQDSGNDDRGLRSLPEVAQAVGDGLLVEVEGDAVAEAPGVLVAIEVEFEVEDDADDVPGAIEFEGSVASVNLDAGTFTITGGLTLTVTERTRFESDGDLFSLAATAAAVDQELPVRVEGNAIGTPGGGWLVALEVKVEVDD
jgi:hypothetical protein